MLSFITTKCKNFCHPFKIYYNSTGKYIQSQKTLIIQENATSVTVPVTIYVDGFENVGAIGPQYNIVVGLGS